MKKQLAIGIALSLFSSMPLFANDVTSLYNQSCATCHAIPVMGAPKTGDKAAWAIRKKQGDDVLFAHVLNGYKSMPAKGLCSDCTDQDLKALISYMSN